MPVTSHASRPVPLPTEEDLAAATRLPPRPTPAAAVRQGLAGSPRIVWLDDDPTGTQTVRGLPVLTSWSPSDLRWALEQDTSGFFVLTNTRSLDPGPASRVVEEVVRRVLVVADEMDVEVSFASRGDSTLRGHHPLETDVIAEVLAGRGVQVRATVLAPAFCDAGRVTLDGVHYLLSEHGHVPVGDSEFARDATFGYRSSRLADWVEEKSGGRFPAADVVELRLDVLRGDGAAVDDLLRDGLPSAPAGARAPVVVVDAETDDDLRSAVLGLLRAERAGARFVYRVGPGFVRARSGQEASPPLDDDTLAGLLDPGGREAGEHGLVVVGSHVGQTSRQLARLVDRRPDLVVLEVDARAVLDEEGGRPGAHVTRTARAVGEALGRGPVVVHTSRALLTGADRQASLRIAARISDALVGLVDAVVRDHRPRYVVAKGGITSADLATRALGVDRAWVQGSVLPGIVSLWTAVGGPAADLPYVVFAGNVGDDEALADVVERLEIRPGSIS